MSNLIFPAEQTRTVEGVGTAGTPFTSEAGLTAVIYNDAAGVNLAGIAAYPSGTSIPSAQLTLDAYGRLPFFYGPDTSTTLLYVKVGTGPVTPIFARCLGSEDPNTKLVHQAVVGALNAAYVASGPQVVDAPGLGLYFPEAHGAKADGATDDTTAVMAAVTAAIAAGGGTVRFASKTYLVNTATSGGGLTWVLGIAGDNVTLEGAPGAVLKTTHASASVIFAAGAGKPAGPANWLTYDCWRYAGDTFQGGAAITPVSPHTLYNINSGAAKGSMTVTTTTAGNAGNFAAGDYIYVRTGQVVPDSTNWNAEPDAEINKVLSVNAGTGVITLERPLSRAYATENQTAIGGQSSVGGAGSAAPLGVVKITDSTMKAFTIRNLRIESPTSPAGTIAMRGAVDGFTLDNVEFDVFGPVMDCQQYRGGRFRNVRAIMRGNDGAATYSPITAAVGCTDVHIENLSAVAINKVCVLQITEGTARVNADGVSLVSGGGTTQQEISLGARARDVTIDNYVIAGANTSSAISISQYCTDGGKIGQGVIRKPSMSSRAVVCSAPNWTIEPPLDGKLGDIQFDTNVRSLGVGQPGRILAGWFDYTGTTSVTLGVLPAQVVILEWGISVYQAFNAGTSNTGAIKLNGGSFYSASVGTVSNNSTVSGQFLDSPVTITADYTPVGTAATTGKALAWLIFASVPTQV